MKHKKQNIRSSHPENTIRMFPQLIKNVQLYASLRFRTPNEEICYQKLIAQLKHSLPMIRHMNNFLVNETLLNSLSYYYSLKDAELKGDKNAPQILQELAPLFHVALLEQICLN